MATVDSDPLSSDGPSITLTIRLIMQGKEVGSIIGKKGDNIKKFREESGAKINISDNSCPERIVTVTGATDAILKAFTLITRKLEEDLHNTPGFNVPKPPVTLRLIVPASQCGSLIGKGGSKIKEIREITGASIQVASEMLPNSTERAVTISGTADAITKCIYQTCCVMMESSPKGATIPYRPKPTMPPVIFAGGQAYTVQGQYAIPHPDVSIWSPLTKLHQLALQNAPLLPTHALGTLTAQDMNKKLELYADAGLLMSPALASLAAHGSLRPGTSATPNIIAPGTVTEMNIPNDLIGCVIGKGGAKINEIRQLSGATIKISNSDESSKDRTVSISGTPEAINLAQYLINTSMELHKNLTLDPNSLPASSHTVASTTPSPLAISLSQLVKPSPLALGLTAATAAYTPTTSVLFADLNNLTSQTRKTLTTKIRTSTSHNGSKKSERNKFSPY